MIVTFYSYKGGVGRSMALANIADQLARSGARVLMVDFDLEAPGLEHFFPIDHRRVRGREGLLDLLLAFKYAMSVAASDTDGEEDAFRDLDRYISTVYPRGSDGGCLDLIPAGLRQTDEQITRYGAELRRFDWQDFYYVWSGELFFEWFRRVCAERYDIVLVDSRTGVTELGGVCAYQLADAVVALCAPNLQNVEGTAWMVRHFLSPQVRSVRGNRPLEVLVVPARVDQQDADLLDTFANRFRAGFDSFTPSTLTAAGLSFWDLQVPYVPGCAFEEQVITDPGRAAERRGLARAYENLRHAIALVAPENNAVAALRSAPVDEGQGRGAAEPLETQYDPTTRFASADVLLSFHPVDRDTALEIRDLLTVHGLRVADPLPDQSLQEAVRAKVNLVLVSPGSEQSAYQRRALASLTVRSDARLLPVLLPGVSGPPTELERYAFLDFRSGLDADRLLKIVRAGLRPPAPTLPDRDRLNRCPYPGLNAFSEAEADVFFGRDKVLQDVLSAMNRYGTCAITGGAGSGKTSLVHAGLLPALRAGKLPGSELWPIVTVRGDRGVSTLLAKLSALVDDPTASTGFRPEDLNEVLGRRYQHVVVVLDHFEEVLTESDDTQHEGTIALLRTLTSTRDPVVVPITVLRADFLVQASEQAPFLVGRPLVVPSMTVDEMREAVVRPAQAYGLQLEPGLTDRLLNDVGGEPGSLPLLQFTLREVWQRRRQGYLTHESYVETGGVRSSLTRAAEQLFTSFSADDRTRARELLLRLVSVDARGRHPRLLVPMATLAASGTAAVCEQMVRQRLLVITADAQEEPCVQLAHEALVDAWPRFRTWIDDARSLLLLREQLSAAAEEWERSERPVSALLGEQGLTLVGEQGQEARLGLGPLATEYLAVSRADFRRGRSIRNTMVVLLILYSVAFSYVASASLYTDTAILVSQIALQGSLLALAAILLRRTPPSRRERRSLFL
ncbi:AAA family ATPase [Streptomyces sp. NBC_00028]|uniref:nSTAND1 domain-containing NTPase n=1 Tax=Streptomyces sp. NBC_00028 TaxID=2975624 RepID=UPI00324A499B